VSGFEDLTDVTYHRAAGLGCVRVAFDRPEVLNAFRPHTVDELRRTLEHARTSSDVGCALLTGNGPGPEGTGSHGKRAFCTGGDQRIRGRSGYQYADGTTADTVDERRVKAEGGRLHVLPGRLQQRRRQLVPRKRRVHERGRDAGVLERPDQLDLHRLIT
jgi:naphthoate synthase